MQQYTRIISIGASIGLFLILFGYGWYITRTVPDTFPVHKQFTILEGENLKSISMRLENEGYIHSALWFRAWASFIGKDKQVHVGGYIFDSPQVLGYILKKVIAGRPDVPLVTLTVPEGSTTAEIASLVKKVLPELSIDIFGEKVFARAADGKLFPSTYFLLPSTTESRVVEIMTVTFNQKYREAFSGTPLPSPLVTEGEVISLAAILEGEAKTEESMKIVAGILLKRLALGMPLQVDVAPITYKVKGLPAQAVNNPGLMALGAVYNPIVTDYLFYITGNDGTMHYAKTFTEHKANIKKYLK